MCQPIRKTGIVKIRSMLNCLKRQTDCQAKYFFKVKATVKDMNDMTTELPKGKNFFAEFVFYNFNSCSKILSAKCFKTDQSKTVIYTFYQYFK